MIDLPRKFEFDCAPFGEGQLYIANLDVTDRHGHVEIKYSPRRDHRAFELDYVFWVETENELAGYFERGIRIITEIYDEAIVPPNIDDLI